MAQTALSFQHFVKRTPPVLDSEKPLPPRPLLARRPSTKSSSRSRSKTPLSLRGRRTSSIYSRTVSQWDADRISWISADFADEPVPPLLLLRPLAYSVSTPQLVAKAPEPSKLQPRTFSPLIRTPSATTTVQVDTPSATQENQDSFFTARSTLSEPLKKHMRTISLEEAKAAVHAPGAVHFLPEELRARQLRKSRSDEALRGVHLPDAANSSTAAQAEPLTLVDKQGRRRTLLSPRDSFAFVAKHPFAISKGSRAVNDLPHRTGYKTQNPAIPVIAQHREASKTEVVQALGLDEFDEPRGRTRHRGPRSLNYEHYLRNGNRVTEWPSPSNGKESRNIAQEYHALLAEQYRKPSDAPAYRNAENDDRIQAYMNMIPQPLFHAKPQARLPRGLERNEEDQTGGPYNLSPAISESGDSTGSGRRGGSEGMSHALSIPNDVQHRRSSTSGTIPISPPEPLARSFTVHSSRSGVSQSSQVTTPKKNKMDSRVSAYYPHVASRKKTKSKKASKDSTQESEIPPMPFLFTRTDTLSIESGSYESTPSSFHAKPFGTIHNDRKPRQESDASSKRPRQPLHQRVAKGAVDLLTHHDAPDFDNHDPITAVTVSEGSPHLLPSPVKSNSKEVHLGWSDIAKSTFDKIVSPTKTPPRSDSLVYTQISTPVRPLDETVPVLREVEPPRRKGSLLGTFLDSWKESKAEKRREELKKMIRYVPFEEEERNVDTTRRSSIIGWM